MKVPSYNKNNRRKTFEQLPKDGYVCKILAIEKMKSKKDQDMIKVSFDIAEGDYKDFYAKQFRENTSEDKKWSYDAVMYLVIPYDGCADFISTNWDTFWADIEDSNNGYVFSGDEKTVKGKVFGGLFRIEQTEHNGNIYDHTRLAFTTVAQNIRDKKFKLPNDKMIQQNQNQDDFINIPESAEIDLPFK